MFIEYIKFFTTFAAVFFLPGFSLLYLFRRSLKLTTIEYLVLSAGVSISVVNLVILALNKLGWPFTAGNLANALFLAAALPFVFSTFPSWKTFLPDKKSAKEDDKTETEPESTTKDFSVIPMNKAAFVSGLVLLAILFLVVTRFLATDIVPNNTDLGHHMYWAEIMRTEQKIPNYDTDEVIVGEHIPFMVVAAITKISLLSAFPVIMLFFFNVLGIMAIYALALRIFRSHFIAWTSLAFTGVLYAISAPMGKFVVGGVVGNIFGNLFIPLIILTFLLSISNKKSEMLCLSIFLLQGIFYIHHLSTFLLVFIIAGSLLIYGVANIERKSFREKAGNLLKTALSPLPLLAVALFLFTLGYVYIPSYISEDSVTTVAQAPTKDTHLGISLNSFIASTGDWRAALGLMGLIIYVYAASKNRSFSRAGTAAMLSWTLVLLLLGFYPQAFMVDLPSRRVANYLVVPLSILAAYSLALILKTMRSGIERRLASAVMLTLGLSLFLNGYADSLSYYVPQSQAKSAVQVYHASAYLAEKTTEEDIILKDHANITADSWIKFFFLRGYNYLLTRTFDYKYLDPDNSGRETCTREMTIAPDSREGLSCYQKTKTGYVFLKKDYDNFLFDASDNFGKIYENDFIVIYKRLKTS